MSGFEHEREYYRIHYPKSERPAVHVDGTPCEVLDCSERGLRYQVAMDQPPPEVGALVRGRVRFRRGDEVTVEGAVLRVVDGEVALHLFPGAGIPLSVVLAEQRYLRAQFALTD